MSVISKARNRLSLMLGDITTVPADAIVNAANPQLLGGGGVDGAIHNAAGHGLYQECLALGGCEPGDAKITGGHGLRARLVIHAVGPEWDGGRCGEEDVLASCYRKSLELAEANGIRLLAFPSIGTGAFGFPLARAAQIAVREILAFLTAHEFPERVSMVCFDPATLGAYRAALKGEGPRCPWLGRSSMNSRTTNRPLDRRWTDDQDQQDRPPKDRFR